jgi:hypothetical protein
MRRWPGAAFMTARGFTRPGRTGTDQGNRQEQAEIHTVQHGDSPN